MQYEVKFLSIAVATVQNFNEIMRKKGHKKIIDEFLNRLSRERMKVFSLFLMTKDYGDLEKMKPQPPLNGSGQFPICNDIQVSSNLNLQPESFIPY